MTEYKKAAADRCIDIMRSTSINASRIGIVLLFVLVTVWVFKIEPQFSNQVRSLKETIAEKQKLELQLWRAGALEVSKENLAQYKKKVREIEESLGVIKETLQIERKAAKTIDFPIPGFGEVPVQAIHAPVFWTLLAFGLLVYLFRTRNSGFRYAADAFRIYSTELQVSNSDLSGYGDGLSWWMRPMPTSIGGKANVTQFMEFLGRNDSGWVATLSLIAFFACIAFAELRMGYLLLSTTGALSRVGLERLLLLSIQLALITSTALLIYRWFVPVTVPHHLGPDKPRNVVTRREFFLNAGFVLGSLLVLPTIRWATATVSVMRRRQPRFVVSKTKKTQNTNLMPHSFYRNVKSNIYHYVFAGGVLRAPGTINESNFKKISIFNVINSTSETTPKVDLIQASISFEAAASRAIKSGEIDTACELLIHGLRLLLAKDFTGFRIADLLAGVAVRNKNGYLEQLISVTILYNLHGNFSGRISKWSDKNSAWYRRWSDKTASVKWADLLM